jgi:predicted O-linked N-acetylglucosamine transferase (SPINDLY family)
MQNKSVLQNYKSTFKQAQSFISKSIDCNSTPETQKFRMMAIKEYEKILNYIEVTDYLLLDSNPIVPRKDYLESFFNLGTLYKSIAETSLSFHKDLTRINLPRYEDSLFQKALHAFVMMLRINFEDELAIKQITSVYTTICFYVQNDLDKCINILQQALLYAPDNETIHYNMGFLFQKMNKIELSVVHYKISLSLCELKLLQKQPDIEELRKLQLNNFNGISCIYRGIKQWPEALHYLLKAEKIEPLDPDIQNQLGVVYTEMRRTDLAEIAYKKAIQHYKKSFISTDVNFFLSELYLNFGHMHAYNGDNNTAIECYNKSLQISPQFALPFQNKIMNLTYLFDQLQDKQYILNQHKLVNKLYSKGNGKFKHSSDYFSSSKINIGIISGDFIDHPVSFFISTFLKNFDHSKFTVTCYSECIIDTSLFNSNLQFKIIKNMSAEQAASLIYNDNIHILFDLAGHTAFNRLDVFALKPCPVQITYVGYPYSTGLSEMDYRITDGYCDKDDVSQPFYTEKLLYLKNCFLCYDPVVVKKRNSNYTHSHPALSDAPFLKNGYLTIGCFNRVNKITDSVVKIYNKILIEHSSIRFLFKTKALLNKHIKDKFINKFDTNVRSRITVLDCTISHEDHLLEYNKVDIAIDTFPYSGTTTSCEALYMGVPVFSLYDSTYYFHPQNVTVSILKNSNLDFYAVHSIDDIHDKINDLASRDTTFWSNLKSNTRKHFLNGYVCNKTEYMKNFHELLLLTIQNKRISS